MKYIYLTIVQRQRCISNWEQFYYVYANIFNYIIVSCYVGDLCDTDIDGDGVNNDIDNCPFYSNSDQADADGNRVGDICELDHDADGVNSQNDSCPYNSALHESSFKDYFTVDLDPSLTTGTPVWLVKNNGGEVMQTTSTEMPTMLIGTSYWL